jgi:aminoglycoside/choline kinase family phosphotransferase
MSERSEARRDFLARSGWGGASVTPLPGDASTRSYARLALDGRRAMLMDQPQGAETPAAPEGADAKSRRALGYNALARLAGADCARFVAAADYLRGRGLAAPEIHAADTGLGFLILEDLGEALFADVLAAGADERQLYEHAAEVLAHLHAEPAPLYLPTPVFARFPRERADARAGAADSGALALFAYDEAALLAETDLFTEWFLPLALGRPARPEETARHRALWAEALARLPGAPRVFVHRDYHAQNLLWLPRRSGVARVGLIDFQDAVAGSGAYDLISLIEDARRDVSPELAALTAAHYLAAMRARGSAPDEAAFRTEMAVMAAQRNVKIVGIFARLYKRDGKLRYLALLPRVWNYLERDLAHPALAPLRAWYDQTIPRSRRALSLEKETQ